MEDNGGDETVKLGERAIEMNIWKKITNMMNLHPFNIDSVSSILNQLENLIKIMFLILIHLCDVLNLIGVL